MPVLINFKICDNSPDCNGIKVCPVKAFYFDEKINSIKVDNSKCISCGKCEKSCSVGAIKVARSINEGKSIEKEIKEDSRKISDLFVDRYGAEPIRPELICLQKDFENQILKSKKITVAELFNSNSIMCMLNSIPIKILFKDFDLIYRKIEIADDYLLKKYKIKNIPSLLFFNNGKLLDKIEGYYDILKKDAIIKKINKILSKLQ